MAVPSAVAGQESGALKCALLGLGLLRPPGYYALRPSGPGDVLDVGCGSSKYPGATGIDISPDTEANLVADLDQLPWPLDDNSFDQILAQDVIEHLERPIDAVTEMHRIGRPGARIQLRTPHFSSALAYGDPTHRHVLSAFAIRSFAEPLFGHYPKASFRIIHVTLDFWDPLRWLQIHRLANRFQGAYEALFAYRFPAMNIRAELEVLK
jgi:SAM-dependent methyltransferase